MSQSEVKRDSEARHPIQVVARRTGLSADLIRMWERRYGAVTPPRSATGRRLYTEANIERLQLLSQAASNGRRIGDVAGLDDQALRQLINTDGVEPAPASAAPVTPVDTDRAARSHLERCLTATRQADNFALERALARAQVEFSVPDLFERVLIPLLQRIGEDWENGALRMSQEHLTTAVLRSFLGNLLAGSNMTGLGPVLVVTTPRGQNHELGALMAAVTAASDGWQVVYLSPNIPAHEIAALALRQQARAVVLGISYPFDDPGLADELQALRRDIPEDVNIIVGGAGVQGYRSALQAIDAEVVESFGDFRELLRGMRINQD